jgi:hypothetical protein
MILDWILSNWNDVLTITLAITTLVIGYYQVKYYRAQSPQVKISEIDDPSYGGKKDAIGSYGENEDRFDGTYYSFDLTVGNEGREPATISKAQLILPDMDEELELLNRQTKTGQRSEIVRLEGNDRKSIYYCAYGDVRDEYTTEVNGIVCLETTTGSIDKQILFQCH